MGAALTAAVAVAFVLLRPRDPGGGTPLPARLLEDSDPGARDSASSAPLDILESPHLRAREAAQRDILDPRADGWDSEVVAEEAKACLERMASLLADPATIAAAALADVATGGVAAGRLRPESLEVVFRDGGLEVRRGRPQETDMQSPAPSSGTGREALAEALKELARPLAGATRVVPHAKIVRVDASGEAAATVALFDLVARFDLAVRDESGRPGERWLQARATWDCRWRTDEEGRLLLESIRSSDHEEVERRGPRWLVDATSAVLGKAPSFREQLVPGLTHWLERIERVHNMHAFARCGIAVGDVNGDGLDDVYVCQPGGLPNRLYVQSPDGTCTDASREARVDWLDHTSSALVVDLDDDGDQDLAAATTFGIVLMENDSSGRFEKRAVLPPVDIDLHSLTAADYDADGDLDLYVCVDFANPTSGAAPDAVGFVYHDANDGGANVLFRNDISAGASDGRWRFTDVTKAVGLDADNRRHSLAAAWEDYDNDGDPDLYVANDYGQNCLYRNDGGRFVNVAAEAGVVDFGSGMSVSWGDHDRDGWMDLYVGNMFSSAGSRVTRQQGFKPGVEDDTRALYSRFAKGNSLFENLGDGTFREVGAEAAVEMGRWAWSSVFADLNNDGWEDLLVANGYITTEDTGDL